MHAIHASYMHPILSYAYAHATSLRRELHRRELHRLPAVPHHPASALRRGAKSGRQNNSNNSNNLEASRLREMVATWKELKVLLAVIDRRFLRLGMLGDGHCPYVSQRLRQHPSIEYLQENLTGTFCPFSEEWMI